MARHLHLSETAVKTHLARIYLKPGVPSRTVATVAAERPV